ncbi:type I-B CRISPR-associated protein Cas8b1/Cst1 [Hydrogenobacter thermophilus]|uniref:type I-B CRISPR-associated protein Cas8b1/Cst1 n=1 Tax=Hydrogenobacter thermophilus TaxID=940 RepID=UPI0030F7FDF9
MVVRFYADNWLMASAIVGFLRACDASTIDWKSWVKDKVLEVPEEIWNKGSDILTEAIWSKEIRNYKERLEKLTNPKEKKISEKLKNPYNSLVLPVIGDFHSNSSLTNPSSKHTKDIESWFRGKVLENKRTGEELKKGLETIIRKESFWEELKDRIKKAIREGLSTLEESNSRTHKAPLCFFCKERETYTYKGRFRTFDAIHFTPLSASSETLSNFFYNGKNTLYLCSQCERLLFFSSLAYTKFNNNYIFVYLAENIEQIYHLNRMLSHQGTITKDFLREAVAVGLKEIRSMQVEYAYKNIYVVEIEKVGDAKANIHTFTFNLRLVEAFNELLDEYPEKFLKSVFDIFLSYAYSGRSLYEFLDYILSGFFYKNRYKNLGSSFSGRLLRVGAELDFLPKSLTYFIKFQEYLQKEETMLERQIYQAYEEGRKLKRKLFENHGDDRAKKRAETLSYRILEAIRRRDIDALQQNLIRAYLELEQEIPPVFRDTLLEKSFNRVAYAFLIGLNGEEKKYEAGGKT